MRGTLLRANLQPLKYILQEQPKENDAPQVSGSKPWHAHVRLWKWSGSSKIMKRAKLGRSTVIAKQRKRYSLLIEGTPPAGRRAVFKEGLGELLVEIVRHRPRDSFPRQDEDHQHGSVTVVPWPLADQTQQLLLFTATPDHLSDDGAHIYTENKRLQQNSSTVTQENKNKIKLWNDWGMTLL